MLLFIKYHRVVDPAGYIYKYAGGPGTHFRREESLEEWNVELIVETHGVDNQSGTLHY